MEHVLIMVVVMSLVFVLCWLAANFTATYTIYKAKNAEHMIHLLLRDTYAMTLVGIGIWILIPNVTWVLVFLTGRALMLAQINWSLIYDKFSEIKHELNKTG